MEADGAIVWYTEAVTRGMAATPLPGSPDMLIINREGQRGVLRVSPRGDVVAFLVSKKASYITGETIYVDGGRLGLNYTV